MEDRTELFLGLLRQHERRMHALVLSLVPDWSAAEDIVQDVKLLLWREFDRYDASKDFGAWCRTIAFYQVLAYRKKGTQRPPALSSPVLELLAEEIQQLPDDQPERLRALGDCLQKLSEVNRRLLMRYYAGQETLRQIAVELDDSFDAVRQRVLRTRKSVANCVERTLREQ